MRAVRVTLPGTKRKRGSGLNSTVKHLLIWVVTVGFLLLGWKYVATTMAASHDKAITFSDMLADADASKIADVTISGVDLTGKYKDSSLGAFHTTVPQNYPDMYKDLRDHGVNVTIKDQAGNLWFGVLLNVAPILVLLALAGFGGDAGVTGRIGSRLELHGGLRAERSARELRLWREVKAG